MKKIVIIAVILIAGLGLWYYWGDGPSSAPDARGQRAAPVKVITQPVFLSENTRVFEAVGTGRARFSVQIYPAVTDEVTAIEFSAQQRVKKNDVLVRLNDAEEKLAVDLASVQVKDARSLLERYRKAVLEGAVPESEVDAAVADYQAAEIALKQARLAMSERQIRAPFDGIVGIPNIDVGDRIGPDTMITTLDDRKILFVDFDVPEALSGVLNTTPADSLKITAETPAYPGKAFSGNIEAQESRIDAERRTLRVRAYIDNNDDMLRPGMSFAVKWMIPGQSFATVPEISIQWEREGSYVWLIKDNKSVKSNATIVARRDGSVLVEGDVKVDDNVVVEGVQRLRPDQNVEVIGAGEQ